MSQLQVVRQMVTTDNQKVVLVRIPEGLDDDFGEVITVCRHELYTFALRLLHNHDEAEEVVQESVVRAYEYLQRPYRWIPFLLDTSSAVAFREGEAEKVQILHPQAWLHTIVYHSALNYIARHSRLVSLDTFEADELDRLLKGQGSELGQPEAALVSAESVQELHTLVDALPPKYAAIIRLRFFGEYDYRAIALELDCPIGTVGSGVKRGLRMLREAMKSQRAVKNGRMVRHPRRSTS